MALVMFTALAGCAGSGAHTQTAKDISPSSLYPLGQGYAWSYDVDTGDQQPTLAIARVLRFEAGVAEVATGGQDQEPLRYTVRDGSIERLGGPGFLLKAPIALGASWPSGTDTTAKVTQLHVKLNIPAGQLDECVVIQEENASSGQRVSTTYCPGIGPAEITSEMDVRGQTLRVVARLRGYSVEAPTP